MQAKTLSVDLQHHTVKEIEIQAYLDGNLTLAGLCQQITEFEEEQARLEAANVKLANEIENLTEQLEVANLSVEKLAEESVEVRGFVEEVIYNLQEALKILER